MFIVYEKDSRVPWHLAFDKNVAGKYAESLRHIALAPVIERISTKDADAIINVYGWSSTKVILPRAFAVANKVSQFSYAKEFMVETNGNLSMANDTPEKSTEYAVYYTRFLAQQELFPSEMKAFSAFIASTFTRAKDGYVLFPVMPSLQLLKARCSKNKDIHWDLFRGVNRLYAYGLPLQLKILLGEAFKGLTNIPSLYRRQPAFCPVCGRIWSFSRVTPCPVCQGKVVKV